MRKQRRLQRPEHRSGTGGDEIWRSSLLRAGRFRHSPAIPSGEQEIPLTIGFPLFARFRICFPVPVWPVATATIIEQGRIGQILSPNRWTRAIIEEAAGITVHAYANERLKVGWNRRGNLSRLSILSLRSIAR
jgi:hypothetical protein